MCVCVCVCVCGCVGVGVCVCVCVCGCVYGSCFKKPILFLGEIRLFVTESNNMEEHPTKLEPKNKHTILINNY